MAGRHRGGLDHESTGAAQRAFGDDVVEKDGNVVVRGELPGLEKKDVKVNVADGALTIEGEQRNEREENGDGWFTSERSYSSFSRRIPLPEGIDGGSCDTRFEDGVLEVTLKKRH